MIKINFELDPESGVVLAHHKVHNTLTIEGRGFGLSEALNNLREILQKKGTIKMPDNKIFFMTVDPDGEGWRVMSDRILRDSPCWVSSDGNRAIYEVTHQALHEITLKLIKGNPHSKPVKYVSYTILSKAERDRQADFVNKPYVIGQEPDESFEGDTSEPVDDGAKVSTEKAHKDCYEDIYIPVKECHFPTDINTVDYFFVTMKNPESQNRAKVHFYFRELHKQLKRNKKGKRFEYIDANRTKRSFTVTRNKNFLDLPFNPDAIRVNLVSEKKVNRRTGEVGFLIRVNTRTYLENK